MNLPPGGELTRNLDNLESAGFIASVTPFDRGANTRFARYLQRQTLPRIRGSV